MPPVIFEPPSGLANNDLELWIGLSGGPNWGGAQVWISTDNASYAFAGTITGGSTQGVLSASLAAYGGVNPDNSHTLSVDLSMSRGQLNSVSPANAANLITLCYVGGELLAFQNAALTSAYHYDLTTLYRGAFGSSPGSHASGAQFLRVDQTVGRFSLPPTLVGQAIYLKFPSFNIVGGALEDISAVPAYSYTVTGSSRTLLTISVPGSQSGPTIPSLVIQRYVFGQSVTFPAGLSGSYGSAGVASTASTTYSIEKNGSAVGTMVFGAGASTASFTMGTATTFAPGDVLTILAPASPDATLANLAWVLVGTH